MAKVILTQKEIKRMAKAHNTTQIVIRRLLKQFPHSDIFVEAINDYIEQRR